MSNEQVKKDYFWKAAVVVVLAVLCVQSFFTYRMMTINNSKLGKQIVSENESLILAPRKIPSSQQQTTAPTIKQHLAPRPLPPLNLNVNNLPGIKPSTTPPQQTPQGRFCQSPASLSPGIRMGFNNIDPFDMDISEEIARMEHIMNAMFSGSPRCGGSSCSGIAPSYPRMNFSSHVTPSVSIDKDQNYVVQLQIPGLDKSEIKAEVNGNLLTVSGVQKEEQTSSGNGGQSYISSYSSFQNSFALPGPAKSKGLKMDYKGDMLTIKIPKA